MGKLRRNILFSILVSFCIVLSFELGVFALFDHQQVTIENVSKESGSDISGTAETDIDHDDARGANTIRSFDLKDLKGLIIINKSIIISGNNHSSVWIPPKLS